MSALAEVAAALEPSLAAELAPELGADRYADRLSDPARRFTVEAVYEGYLLHYGEPRAFGDVDADLRLLAGDALYALGLGRVAQAGDLEAVAELADLIAGVARAHAEQAPERADALWTDTIERLT